MTDAGIQFENVETDGGAPAPAACAACNGGLGDSYWTVNGQVTCSRCKEGAATFGQGGSGMLRFAKAVSFGTVGGAAGAVVWYLVAHFLNMQAGLVAILVGFLVGGGVRLGCERRGGWLYQLLAIVITYAAIVAGWFPEVLKYVRDEGHSGAEAIVMAGFGSLIGPFVGGIMGLIITLIAFYEAWKMNKRPEFEITGPHRLAASPAAAPPPLPTPLA